MATPSRLSVSSSDSCGELTQWMQLTGHVSIASCSRSSESMPCGGGGGRVGGGGGQREVRCMRMWRLGWTTLCKRSAGILRETSIVFISDFFIIFYLPLNSNCISLLFVFLFSFTFYPICLSILFIFLFLSSSNVILSRSVCIIDVHGEAIKD